MRFQTPTIWMLSGYGFWEVLNLSFQKAHADGFL